MERETNTTRTLALTCAALVGFAANSFLGRMALGSGSIDAATYTVVRLASGAIVLAVLTRIGRGSSGELRPPRAGSWVGATALFAYAAAFSFAYLRLATGVGALVLFAAVQITMIGWGLFRGERPRVVEWIGLGLAFGGIVMLVRPGLTAPDAAGVGLMFLAGVAWGVYSLRGRGTARPLAATADNFLRSVPLAAVLIVLAFAGIHADTRGVVLAVVSGGLASGVGYSLWYAALRGLTATRAAIVQLSVPVLAALGGIAMLGETVTLRLAIAGVAILGGVALALWRPAA